MRNLALAALAAIALVCLPAAAQQSFFPGQGVITQGSIVATGTPPDANSACFSTHGLASVTITVGGTWVGTIQFFYSTNDATFALLPMGKFGVPGPVTGTTVNTSFFAPISGYGRICASASAWTSGTATVFFEGSQRGLDPLQLSALNFAVNSTPAVNTLATASQAVGGAGVRHVGTSCSGSINTVAAQPAITLNLRNGASGAGSVVWSAVATCALGSTCTLSTPPGLIAVGSANTAMTCEWSGIPAVGNFEVANLTGYDVP